MTSSGRFSGKRVLITGGSRGIGRACALAYAAEGATLALVYRGDEAAALATQASLDGEGHSVVQADVGNPAEAASAVAEAADRLGGLDILVNNAGTFTYHPLASTEFDRWVADWNDTLATNLLGPAYLCHAAARLMIPQGSGKIICVSSRGAFRGEPDAPAYGASKAGLNAMSQSLAVALAPHGIFVAVVAPGFIETDMAAESLAGPGGEAIRRQSPLGRVGRPDEVANAVLMLSADGIDFATGAIVDVSGASYLRS